MPAPDLGPRLKPSLLDRLIDPEAMDRPSAPGYSEREMMAAVRADLEALLNTRMSVVDVPDDLELTQRSIVTYGLPDLVSYNPTTPEQSAKLARIIEEVISRHEPRLKNVRVSVQQTKKGSSDQSIRFHIDAVLNVDPVSQVGFETVLQLLSGHAEVRSSGPNP